MQMKKIKIGERLIGEGDPLYFIADIAANHDGSLKRACRLIELAKESGADAAKFQNFQASKIVSKKGFQALGKKLSHQASWKKPVYEIYQDASIPFNWSEKLRDKCKEVGIEYLTSPYDFDSVDNVDRLVNAYKIGSGDITWPQMIEYIAKKGKPVILATGASSMADVDRAMKILLSENKNIILMQCNTNYTASAENFKYLNLNVLKIYRKKYPSAVLGLSDHTHGHSAVLGAIALGARVFEKHFTDDNDREGPDHKFAMNPESWKEMVKYANELYQALGDGVKKVEGNEKESIVVQRRCLRITKDLKRGHILSQEDIFPLRPIPAKGIPPYKIKDILGKRLLRDVSEGDFLRMEDFKDA